MRDKQLQAKAVQRNQAFTNRIMPSDLVTTLLKLYLAILKTQAEIMHSCILKRECLLIFKVMLNRKIKI
jgi:hypothetical protein